MSGSSKDVFARIEKRADELVEKSGWDMTREQAVDRVLKTREGAELYKEYLAACDSQSGGRFYGEQL